MPKKVALILAGGVAKGAYTAGVLKVVAEQGLEVTRIVATSSGALNGALYASYVRRGMEREGTDDLVELWTHQARFGNVFSLDPAALRGLQGVFSSKKVRKLLQTRIAHGKIDEPRPVSLRMLVAPLRGIYSRYLDALSQDDDPDPLPPARNRTTYEYVCDFTHEHFDTEEERDRLIDAALASAAFPLVFCPVVVRDRKIDDEIGPCIDGGAVDNAPIKWAMGGRIGDELDAIIVVAPSPELEERPRDVRGARLIEHTATMLVNERLYRDLRETERVNAQLARLDKLAPEELSLPQLAAVKHALGWTKMRQIGIVQIRPLVPLEGNPFTAFLSRRRRERYLELGQEHARTAFADPVNQEILFGRPVLRT